MESSLVLLTFLLFPGAYIALSSLERRCSPVLADSFQLRRRITGVWMDADAAGVCVCLPMYVHVRTYVRSYVCVCLRTYVHTYLRSYVRVCLRACVPALVHIRVCIRLVAVGFHCPVCCCWNLPQLCGRRNSFG